MDLFLLAWAIFFGAFVRFAPALDSPFPINDGGLFYAMVGDLVAADYSLPFYSTYNAAHIPFAYPPLPFYLTALLSKGLGIPLLVLMRWLPPFVTALTIPAFYLLARAVLKSRLQASLASVAFAMLPSAFDLFIVGGGLTRSFGALFSLLTLFCVYRLFSGRERKYLFYTILCASLLVYSHPEVTFHTVWIVALLWLFLGRDRQSLGYSMIVAIGVLLCTAPWWGVVLWRHGFEPFRSIMQSGWHQWLFWTPLLRLDFSGERFLGIITVLGVVGFLAALLRRNFLLVAWLLLPFLTEPRNPYFSAAVPLSMLAAIGFDEVVLPGLRALEGKIVSAPSRGVGQVSNLPSARWRLWKAALRYPSGETGFPLDTRSGKLLLTFFLIYTLINAFAFAAPLAGLRVTDEELAAVEWVNANTPANARFALLTYGDPFNTPIQEWFPALTGRINLAVVQGYEWLPGRQFYTRRDDFPLLMRCLFLDVECLEDWGESRQRDFDYVYVSQSLVGKAGASDQDVILGNSLIQSMQSSPDYRLVYASERIKIFRRLTAPKVP